MPPSDEQKEMASALARKDVFALARAASKDDLDRMMVAEDLIERHRKRSSRIAIASQALVGYVALAGFFANAYQNWNNKQEAQRQRQADNERWSREFKRAQDADKYRAFFETSALATDLANPDKRLVGYTLLKEFVNDQDYNPKATMMLEESLAETLRRNDQSGPLDTETQAAVVAILTSLADTNDCRSLEKSTKSVGRLAKHLVRVKDAQGTAGAADVFSAYVTELVGRAVQICSGKDFQSVRRPIRDTLIKVPELGGASGKLGPAEANTRIAEILRDHCVAEMAATGVSDCPDTWRHYDELCTDMEKKKKSPADLHDEEGACKVMRDSRPPAAAAPAPPPSPSP